MKSFLRCFLSCLVVVSALQAEPINPTFAIGSNDFSQYTWPQDVFKNTSRTKSMPRAVENHINPTFAIRDSDLLQYTCPQNDLSNRLCMIHTLHNFKNPFETKFLQNLIHSNSESRVKTKSLQKYITANCESRVKIVAAENFYGDIAKQIGGSSVKVTTILNNPNQDPHEFQADAATAMAIANADLIIYNGIGYDSWMEKLLQARGKKAHSVIKVADLVGAKSGDNPHLWYDPKTMPILAEKLSQLLQKPTELSAFTLSMQPLTEKIAALKKKYTGVKVTATEPVFGYMTAALGFEMMNVDYQVAMMNGTEPSFQQTADFQNSLTNKKTQILFYNNQVLTPSTQRMQAIAQQNNIPIVGVSEMQPASEKNYQAWMMSELLQVEEALYFSFCDKR